MAIASLNVYSYALGMNTDINVLLPERRLQPHLPYNGKKLPVLYLLHGHAQDYSSWLRNAQLEYYLRDSDAMVVMPNGYRGFYTDAKHGLAYFTFLTEELPQIIRNWFPASEKREDTYIAGLSMGGYGAFKAALRRPDVYCAAASLSGALIPRVDIAEMQKDQRFSPEGTSVRADMDDLVNSCFGTAEEFKGSISDLEAAAVELAASDAPKPKFYQCCGKQDIIYPINVKYRESIEKNAPSLPYEYWESEGVHNWEFWNREIENVLKRFQLI